MKEHERKDENGITSLAVVPAAEMGVISQIVRAEVDMQVTTAKAYPRSVAKARADMEDLACISKEVAESCFYTIPRANELIEGPSTRLAEIAISCWGNTRTEAKIIEVGRTEVTAQATTWDMEKNVLVRIEASRRITDKNGNRFNLDMIGVTSSAAISIALRNSVFRVIPRAIIDEVYRKARQVAFGNAKAISQSRAVMFETFGKLGVDEVRLLTALEVESVDDVGAVELSKLRGTFNAIRDGSVKIEDAFPPTRQEAATNPSPTPQSRTGSVMDRLAGRTGAETGKPKPPESSPADQSAPANKPTAGSEPAPAGPDQIQKPKPPLAKKERLIQIEQTALRAGIERDKLEGWKKEIDIRDQQARTQTTKRLDTLQARLDAWTGQQHPPEPDEKAGASTESAASQIVVKVSQKIVDGLLDRIRGLIGWEDDEARQWVERVLDEQITAMDRITANQVVRLEGVLDQRESSIAETDH